MNSVEKKQKTVRRMITLNDFGFSISIYGIATIDKITDVNSSIYNVNSAEQRWGISINHNMEPTIRYPRTNIDLWYNTEQRRDQQYEQLLQALQSVGYEFTYI